MVRILATRFLLSRAAWRLFCLGRRPWEATVRRGALLERLWDLELETDIPAVHREPWRVVTPSRSRALFMQLDHRVSIREHRALPAAWRALGPMKQLEVVAGEVLAGIESDRQGRGATRASSNESSGGSSSRGSAG